jgi:hypothetical protein
MKTKFTSDIKLGERYQDQQTGISGTAVAIIFFQHGCERVDLETVIRGGEEIKAYAFDAPRLVHIESGEKVTTTRTGGPDRSSDSLRRGGPAEETR